MRKPAKSILSRNSEKGLSNRLWQGLIHWAFHEECFIRYTQKPSGSTTTYTNELGPVIPRTVAPLPAGQWMAIDTSPVRVQSWG